MTFSALPRCLVVGGSYVDEMLFVNRALQPDRSFRVMDRSEALGGPGYCFGVALARQGFPVELATALGGCDWSVELRRRVTEEGIELRPQLRRGFLDRATVVVDPDGAKIALNAYSISRTIACPVLGPGGPPLVLVASPASLADVAARIGGFRGRLVLAPHSEQCAQLTALPNRRALLAATWVVAVSTADYGPALHEVLRHVPVLVVTCGPDGARVRHQGRWSHFTARPVPAGSKPLNTNGAGEAYLAGFLRCLAGTGSTDEAALAARDVAHRYLTHGVCGEFPRVSPASTSPAGAVMAPR